MRYRLWVFFFAVCIFAFSTYSPAMAQVMGNITQTIKTEAPPVDIAASLDGKWLFVLTNKGEVRIRDLVNDEVKGSIYVGEKVDGIAVGPRADVLYLSDGDKGEVRVLTLDFIHDFDLAGSPSRGPADAPVVLTLFTDFECSYCSMMAPLLDSVLQLYPEHVMLVFKNFPLRGHEYAIDAAAAAIAADGQGKFWEFHDRLFRLQADLDDEKIMNIAGEMKLDLEKFDEARNAPETMDRIRKDAQAGYNAGVKGTPTVFINGRILRRRGLQDFQEAIDIELEKLNIKKKGEDS